MGKAQFISDQEYKEVKNFNFKILVEWSKRIVEYYWGDKLTLTIPVYYGDKMWNTGGMFVHNSTEPLRVIISKNIIRANSNTPEEVEDVLKHELCHYAIFMLFGGRDCADGHPTFENELKRINARSTRTSNFNLDYRVGVLICPQCGKYQGYDGEYKPTFPYSDCCNKRVIIDSTYSLPSEKTALDRRIYVITHELERRKR